MLQITGVKPTLRGKYCQCRWKYLAPQHLRTLINCQRNSRTLIQHNKHPGVSTSLSASIGPVCWREIHQNATVKKFIARTADSLIFTENKVLPYSKPKRNTKNFHSYYKHFSNRTLPFPLSRRFAARSEIVNKSALIHKRRYTCPISH